MAIVVPPDSSDFDTLTNNEIYKKHIKTTFNLIKADEYEEEVAHLFHSFVPEHKKNLAKMKLYKTKLRMKVKRSACENAPSSPPKEARSCANECFDMQIDYDPNNFAGMNDD